MDVSLRDIVLYILYSKKDISGTNATRQRASVTGVARDALDMSTGWCARDVVNAPSEVNTSPREQRAADEEDFLQLIVANDTVLTWLDKWDAYEEEGHYQTPWEMTRLAVLLEEIAKQVSEKEPYAEEARECGMADRALRTMKLIQRMCDGRGDSDGLPEQMMNSVSSILAACSGPLAQGNTIKRISFANHDIVVKEGALGDGVGAKLWRVARIMCHRMIDDADRMVAGKTVLDVGAGVGACGFLASKLGAEQVLITDYVDTLLSHLKDALELNFPECSSDGDPDAWTRDATGIRFLDWEESVRYLMKGDATTTGTEKRPPPAALDGESSGKVAPGVPEDLVFDTIIGTDVLYEWPMVRSLSAAIKHRLKPGGRAYICNAVRDQAMFDAFIDSIQSRGLTVSVEQISNEVVLREDDVSTFCQDQDYEGGYVWVEISHEGSP